MANTAGSVILTYFPNREYRPRRGARIIGSKRGVRIEPGTSTITADQYDRIKEVKVIKDLLEQDCLKVVVMEAPKGKAAKADTPPGVWQSTQTQLSKINGVSVNAAKALQAEMPEDGWDSLDQMIDTGKVPPGADITALSEKFK